VDAITVGQYNPVYNANQWLRSRGSGAKD